MRNNPIRYNDPTGHWENETDDPVKERHDNAKKNELRREFKKFKKIPTYSKHEMKDLPVFLWWGTKVNPDEYALLLNEDGELDREKMLTWASDGQEAYATAEAYFSEDKTNQGQRNAFQHAYWTALLTMHFGTESARAMTSAHEKNNDAVRETQFMDLYNNKVGIKIAEANPNASVGDILFEVYEAVLNGDMVVMTQNKRKFDIYFSNACPTCSAASNTP